jgi:ubiquinol-cytochrome c reductase cytochrome b subunit
LKLSIKVLENLAIFFEKWNKHFPTAGHLSFASFWLALISGIPLLYVYFQDLPLDSLELLLIQNSWGIFFRALHYWSGQIFLVTMLLHLFEYLLKNGERTIRFSIWVKLIIVIPIVFYIMLSGYILKGDQEGVLANNILTGLIGTIPFVSTFIKTVLLGNRNSYNNL